MEVKPGYKQEKVGVIPETWDVVRIGQLFTFKNGLNKAKQFFGYGTPIVNYMDVFGHPGLHASAITGLVDVNAKELDAYEVRKGDVFFTRTSETVDEVGIASVMLDEPTKMVYSGFVLRARPIDNCLEDAFKVYCFAPRYFRQQVTSRASYTTRALTNGRSLSAALLAKPPKPEQRAIAAALSDVDALLLGLDRLIAKKHDLKQAAMQQLLTGQTRLPGFEGVWEHATLKRAAEISTGINKPVSEMGRGALYVTVQDLYLGTSIRAEQLGRIRASAAEIATRSLEPGDIVFGKSSVKREGIGYPSQFLGSTEPVVFSGFTYRARARAETADSTFLFYALRSTPVRRWLIDNSQSSALTNINQRIADAIPLTLPPLAEQIAIAAVLSDMDAELTALQARRDKTGALKQGMMQELLTGRTRLV